MIGRTFSDAQAGIHITPVAKAGTTPEAMDVVVNVGAFPGNLPPTLTLNASATTITAGGTVNFTADADRPGGRHAGVLLGIRRQAHELQRGQLFHEQQRHAEQDLPSRGVLLRCAAR